MQNQPHFGFFAAFCARIGRMNLQRKILPRVNQFDQQRKRIRYTGDIAQPHTGEHTVLHAAIRLPRIGGGMNREHQIFADPLPRGTDAEQPLQCRTAPERRTLNGCQFHGTDHIFLPAFSVMPLLYPISPYPSSDWEKILRSHKLPYRKREKSRAFHGSACMLGLQDPTCLAKIIHRRTARRPPE
ncbi:unknown [Clostridium sp. CAG:448]|nr:unknown [Clostridium sp. CAG:448]